MASEIKVDTISEKTSANGVTIDSVNIKDGKIATANSIDSDAYVDGSIDTAHITDANITTAKIADDAITLAKMASGTDGNIISYDASGNPVAIATGSDGQVLTSTGAGSPPAFEAVAGGDVVKVGSGSFTSGDPTSVAIDGYFDDSTYHFYKLFAMFQITDGSNDTNPHLIQRINIGGTAQTSGAYDWWITEGRFSSGSAAVSGRGAANATYARAMASFNSTQADASDGNTYWVGEYEFYKPTDTSVNKTWKFNNAISAYHSSGAWAEKSNGAASYASTSAISGVTFLYENGAGFEKGYWTMYGYKI